MFADALLAFLRDHIAGLGFDLVDLRRAGTLERPILQVRVDRPDSQHGHGIPDDDHVTLRQEDGTDITVALADVSQANLIDPSLHPG